MSPLGLGCVKTCTRKECAELFSLLASPDSGRQRYWFSNRRNRDGISTIKFCVGVFTQPGSKADLTALKFDFRYTPDSGHRLPARSCPKSAKCGSYSPFRQAIIRISVEYVDADIRHGTCVRTAPALPWMKFAVTRISQCFPVIGGPQKAGPVLRA